MSLKITIILYWCFYMLGVCLIVISELIQKSFKQLFILVPPILQLVAYALFYQRKRHFLEVMFPIFIFFQQLILLAYQKPHLLLSCYFGYIGIHALYVHFTAYKMLKWISSISLILTMLLKIYYFSQSEQLTNIGVVFQIFGCYFLFYTVILHSYKNMEKTKHKELEFSIVI